MESLLPSEVARLVYGIESNISFLSVQVKFVCLYHLYNRFPGYLKEEQCDVAAQAFLEKSLHLKECYYVSKKGRKFNTRIYGMNLIDLLDLLNEAVNFGKYLV